jgi:hypothetical protein
VRVATGHWPDGIDVDARALAALVPATTWACPTAPT